MAKSKSKPVKDQPPAEAGAADQPQLKRYAVHYTHSLLGERVVEAANEEEAIAKYGELCAGFKSEHLPTVRCLSTGETLAVGTTEVAAVVPPNGLVDGVDLNAAVKPVGDNKPSEPPSQPAGDPPSDPPSDGVDLNAGAGQPAESTPE